MQPRAIDDPRGDYVDLHCLHTEDHDSLRSEPNLRMLIGKDAEAHSGRGLVNDPLELFSLRLTSFCTLCARDETGRFWRCHYMSKLEQFFAFRPLTYEVVMLDTSSS